MVEYAGYLTKRSAGKYIYSWHLRWFEISNEGTLCYYVDASKVDKKGEYKIDDETQVGIIKGNKISNQSIDNYASNNCYSML